MYVSDRLVYLQLQKTASTHITAALMHHFPGEHRGKHAPLTFDPGTRLIVGSVRNPWDWYVSLWAYGCQKRGSVHSHLASPALTVAYRHLRGMLLHPTRWHKSPAELRSILAKDTTCLRALYASADDPKVFRRWLKFILSGADCPYMEHGYSPQKAADAPGLMTFRFLRLFTRHERWLEQSGSLPTFDAARRYYEQNAVVDEFIKVETLEQDLERVLAMADIDIDGAYIRNANGQRTNSSRHASAAYYYDDETMNLVRTKDRLVADLFDYRPAAS